MYDPTPSPKFTLTRRSLLAAGGLAGAGAFLAACGGSSAADSKNLPTTVNASTMDSLVAAAKKEGTLTLYNSLAQPDTDAWVKAFTAQYGIKVQVQRLAGAGPEYSRWKQEWNARRYLVDALLLADPQAMRDADKRGMVAEFTPSQAAQFDPKSTLPGKAYPIIFAAEPMTWNTTKISAAEKAMLTQKNIGALADPIWKNRLSVLIPVGIPINQAEWSRIVAKYGWDFVEAIAANKPTIYESAVPLNDRLVAGEQSVAVFDSTAYSARSIIAGAPLEFAYDNQAAVTWFSMAVAEKAPHPNAARLFQEWSTSTAGVSGLMSILGASGGRTDVKDQSAVAQKPWYKPLPSSDLLTTWASDPAFTAGAQAFNDKWSKMFGYSK